MANEQLELNQYMPCQLAELSNSIIHSVADLFEDWYDLSISEWKVMVTIAEHPGLSGVAVAESAGLDTVAVSRAVTTLMDTGRIHREFGREDRRRSILRLSDEGRALYQKVLPVAIKLQASLLDDLTEEERLVFAKAIKKLSERSSDFVLDIRHEMQQGSAVVQAAKHQVPLRTHSVSPTKPGIGVMPSSRAV